jgi:hypothetical protein
MGYPIQVQEAVIKKALPKLFAECPGDVKW